MTLTAPPAGSAIQIKNLVDASFATRYDDLEAMLGHSTAAVALVEAVQEELPAQLVASAWTQHGNALRLTGCYAEAEGLLDRAAALPVSDLPTSIHLLEVRSSLDRNMGRYESA